jgi:hypothetical protein
MFGIEPSGTARIAHSPYLFQGATRYTDMTTYTAASGATVFATGSMQWNWGLDDYNAPNLRFSRLNAAARQMTRNVLARGVGPPPSVIPFNGLALWLRADAGTVLNGGAVNQWSDQSGNEHNATQGTSSSRPTLINAALNGYPVVRFDGVDDFLTFPLAVNGLGGMSVFVVAANTQNQNGGPSGAERSALFWNESAGWGGLYLSPYHRAGTPRLV